MYLLTYVVTSSLTSVLTLFYQMGEVLKRMIFLTKFVFIVACELQRFVHCGFKTLLRPPDNGRKSGDATIQQRRDLLHCEVSPKIFLYVFKKREGLLFSGGLFANKCFFVTY